MAKPAANPVTVSWRPTDVPEGQMAKPETIAAVRTRGIKDWDGVNWAAIYWKMREYDRTPEEIAGMTEFDVRMVFGVRLKIRVSDLPFTNPAATVTAWPSAAPLTQREQRFWDLLTAQPQPPATLARLLESKADKRLRDNLLRARFIFEHPDEIACVVTASDQPGLLELRTSPWPIGIRSASSRDLVTS